MSTSATDFFVLILIYKVFILLKNYIVDVDIRNRKFLKRMFTSATHFVFFF